MYLDGSSTRACRMRLDDARRYACGHCRVLFKPKHSTRVTYCSRECAYAAKATAPYSMVHFAICARCDASFCDSRKRKYCSESCWPSAAASVTVLATRQCKLCAVTYQPHSTGGRPSEYCSATCNEAVKGAVRRIHKLRRRARTRTATIESVDPIKVFARDGWRCKLCGVDTPKALRGTLHPASPELDHVVPLSRGGAHSYSNTQCACRRCNGAKGDKLDWRPGA